MIRLVAALISVLTLPLVATAQGNCDGCDFAARGDRSEGVWKERSLISGASFPLQSVHHRGAPSNTGTELKLHFYMPQAGEVSELVVWRPLPSATNDKISYKMEPDRKSYEQGLREFSWPRGEVIDRLGLALGSLHTRIMFGEGYVPALLSTGSAPESSSGYVFVFDSGAGVDATCTISNAEGQEIASFECYEELGGNIAFEWDGRDANGQTAPDGLYRLQIEGDMLAEVLRTVETTVPFWHQVRLN